MNKLLLCILACCTFATAATASSRESSQCSALIKKTGSNLKIIRSGDLIGDGARGYVAVGMLPQQPRKGMYISRLLIARAEGGRCSIMLDAGKNGPKNPVGYLGIDYIDDSDQFYGYRVEFGSDVRDPAPDPRYKGVLYLTWLNPKHEPEGAGIVVGWNEKVGRYQEIDSSWEMFNPELRKPRHISSRFCRKCSK
jgi:hypothetical protein